MNPPPLIQEEHPKVVNRNLVVLAITLPCMMGTPSHSGGILPNHFHFFGRMPEAMWLTIH